MLKLILIGLLVLVVGFLITVALQPGTFRITRSTTMSAPPAAVFAQVNDFHRWEGWNPWQKMDPTAKITFAGPPVGQGSSMDWDGLFMDMDKMIGGQFDKGLADMKSIVEAPARG